MISPEQLAASGTESGHQKALFCWSALNIKQYPQLRWLYAVPNGFFSTPGQKAKMNAEGLNDGVPDICLAVPTFVHGLGCTVCGLYIEMKREKYRFHKDGGCSKEQLEWLDYLNEVGYKALVAYSWIEARDIILDYLNGTQM